MSFSIGIKDSKSGPFTIPGGGKCEVIHVNFSVEEGIPNQIALNCIR